MAGSAAHPGGAISGGAGYITRRHHRARLGLKLWWKPWDAGEALGSLDGRRLGARRRHTSPGMAMRRDIALRTSRR